MCLASTVEMSRVPLSIKTALLWSQLWPARPFSWGAPPECPTLPEPYIIYSTLHRRNGVSEKIHAGSIGVNKRVMGNGSSLFIVPNKFAIPFPVTLCASYQSMHTHACVHTYGVGGHRTQSFYPVSRQIFIVIQILERNGLELNASSCYRCWRIQP